MTLKKATKCGTLESNDIFLILTPTNNGIEIDLESTVQKQFGEHIKELIKSKLLELGIDSVHVQAQDKGALDYTIRARVEAAVIRGL